MSKTPFAIAAVAAFTAGASAQIATFTFSDLNGSFDAGTSVFNAAADANTSGDATRLLNAASGTPGSAQFDTGFMAGLTSADFDISLSLSAPSGGTIAANGTFTVTDHNGDEIIGDIAGLFSTLGPAISYDGALSNVFFNDNSGDGTFDGPSGGSFSSDFAPFIAPFEGTIVQLFFSPGSFFTQSFSNASVLASALVVPDPILPPAPGSVVALLGAGALASRRRR